jgi:1-phosphofructokinase family hexose kinase
VVVALTPNPALDRTLSLDAPLVPGQLHRVQAVREAAGGKGVNVARVIHALGGNVICAGFLAGDNGRKFRRLLAAEGIAGVFQEVEGETRECHILLDGKSHPTEIYERGPTITEEAWHHLVDRLPAGRIVISGSLLPGLEPPLFSKLISHLPVAPIVDTSGPALLAALTAGVAMIKPNRQEILEIESGHADAIETAQVLFKRYRVPILLTLGAEGTALVRDEILHASAPKVDTVNPIGSGDSLLGAYLWAVDSGLSEAEALRLGVAAGVENATRGGGGRVTVAGVKRFKQQVRVREVPS